MGLLDKLLGKKSSPPPPDDFTVRLVHTIRCFMDASMLLVEGTGLVDTSQKLAIVYGYYPEQ